MYLHPLLNPFQTLALKTLLVRKIFPLSRFLPIQTLSKTVGRFKLRA